MGAPPSRVTRNFNSDTRREINKLANSNRATVTTNRDGSQTRTQGSTHGRVTREGQLTTSKGLLRQAQTQYTHTTTRPQGQHGVDKQKYTASSQSDYFGRTTSSTSREQTRTRGAMDSAQGQTSLNNSRTTNTDRWGNKTTTESKSTTHTRGTQSKNVAQTHSHSRTTDPFGNKSVTSERKTVAQDGKTAVTTSTKTASGTQVTTQSTAGFQDGKYSIGEQADWKRNRSTERSYSRETERRPGTADNGFTQQRKDDKLTRAQQAGDVLGAAGAKTTLSKGGFSNMKENNLIKNDPNAFVGTRHGTSGRHEVTLGADGLKASGNIEAKAGLYAEKKSADIKQGEAGAQYSAAAKAEAIASARGNATINANGLDASAGAKVGVTAEASISGRAQTRSVRVAGVDMNASVEGTAKVSATAQAEATAKAKITRNPPTAIVEGSVGASAVAKAEAEAKVSAGPFSVKGNVYGSAGAEATAKGSIGYEDGKIKISGSMGAALGLGAGGGVGVEVDVKQIGTAAKNTAVKVADANGDGKVSLADARTVASNAANTVKNTASAVKDTAKDAVNGAKNTVKKLFGF